MKSDACVPFDDIVDAAVPLPSGPSHTKVVELQCVVDGGESTQLLRLQLKRGLFSYVLTFFYNLYVKLHDW